MEIVHNEAVNRFEIDLGDGLAMLEYIRQPRGLILTHTEVPEAHENQGIGGRLVRHVLDHARENGLTIVPLCPFVAAFIHRNPVYADLVDERMRPKKR